MNCEICRYNSLDEMSQWLTNHFLNDNNTKGSNRTGKMRETNLDGVTSTRQIIVNY